MKTYNFVSKMDYLEFYRGAHTALRRLVLGTACHGRGDLHASPSSVCKLENQQSPHIQQTPVHREGPCCG